MIKENIDIGKEVIELQIKALKKLKNTINDSFGKAVDALLKCKSKVIICGVGKSGIIASKISATLSSVGTPSFSISASDCSHGDLGRITNKDISKQFQNSDFGGELTPEQLKYCANDVIYLHKIHDELNKILIRENRVKLYRDCLNFLKTRVDLDLALFKDDIWSH